jgi:hypothetical protein
MAATTRVGMLVGEATVQLQYARQPLPEYRQNIQQQQQQQQQQQR